MNNIEVDYCTIIQTRTSGISDNDKAKYANDNFSPRRLNQISMIGIWYGQIE